MDIAKQYTRHNNNDTAVLKFKEVLLGDGISFNSEDFPEIESNEDAIVKCRNAKLAEKNCPKRWRVMQEWIKSTEKVWARFLQDGKGYIGRCQGKECKGFTQNGAFMSYVLCMDVLWEYGNSLNFSVCTSVGRFSLSYCPSISISASYPECPIFVPVFRCLCLSISCRLYLYIILSLILCLSVYLYNVST